MAQWYEEIIDDEEALIIPAPTEDDIDLRNLQELSEEFMAEDLTFLGEEIDAAGILSPNDLY